jgi:hypothetical protein
VIAALLATPMLWPHYLALLFVPIALAAPRLSALWFSPLLAYVAPVAQTTGRPWVIALYLAVVAVPLVRLCSQRALREALPVAGLPAPAQRLFWRGEPAGGAVSPRSAMR